MTSPDTWSTRNNTGFQTLAGVGMVAVGAVLALGFRHFEGPGFSNSLAGFLLGLMLLAIGLGGLAFGGSQTITVDSRRRRIQVAGRNRFRRVERVIPFADIARVGIGRLGGRSSGSVAWYVVLTLRSGDEVPLFFPFYDGQYDRAVAESRRERLLDYLGRAADQF